MRAGTALQRTMLIIKVRREPDSIHYRAYAERLQEGSVLDWILSRFRAGAPPGIEVACMCESEAERDRLRAACHSSCDVQFLCVTAPDETHQCRFLMDEHRLQRLIMVSCGHAVLPLRLMRNVLKYHDALGADLTDASCPTFTDWLYVIESSMVDRLLDARQPALPDAVIPAALQLREARVRHSRLAPVFCWPRLEISKMYGIEAARWPELIALRSSRDVSILRGALGSAGAQSDDHYIDSWKRSAISVRGKTHHDESKVMQSRMLRRSSRRVRVLYVSDMSSFAGASPSLCELIDGLDRQRYEPFALVSYSGVFTDELRRLGVTVICPNDSISTPDVQAVRFARSVIRDISPDIVHGNHGIGVPLTDTVVAAGLPLVQHVRVASLKALHLQVHAADVVIAVSHFIRQRIAVLDVDPGKVEVIFDGVDVNRFKPDPLSRSASRERFAIPRDEFVVVMIARFVEYKRHDSVIKAVGRLRRLIGRGHLLLVGGPDGDRGYGHQIESWIEEEGLSSHASRVEFTLDIPSVLHASDALALLSRDEALGRVVVEAMAVGLPVVVSDSGGPGEVVEAGRTGFIVPFGNSAAAASVLSELALNPERARSVGSAAAAAVRASLTHAHCAEKTMQVYERVLGAYRDDRIQNRFS